MPARRTVLKTMAGAGLLTAASHRKVLGANDRVRVGFVGNGLIGKRHLLDFQGQPDVDVVGVCEVSDERLDEAAATAGSGAQKHKDFRRLFDRADVDAVVVSTPDHWHALMTILACTAGKDVYVEKPLTHALREGEWMLRAATHHRRVVQVGTQQRSGRHYQQCRELIRGGHIGDVRSVRMGAHRNILPGFSEPVGKPLSTSDWDMWLGPAPFVPWNSRPPPPLAATSRLDQVARNPGYSKIASKTSGVSPNPWRANRPPRAVTRCGKAPVTHCTMSIS